MKKKLLFVGALVLIVFLLIGNWGCDPKQKPCPKPVNLLSNKLQEKIRLNVYVENSGSMDGYVKGITEFKQSVYNYLCDIKISEICDSLNLCYVNSEIIPYNIKSKDEVSDFIQKLDPATFRQRGGDRSTSDIADIMKMIVGEIDEHSIAVFVSDCIFSPGKGVDADGYLINQQIGIKTVVAELLKRGNYATIIYRLTSTFDGVYYNKVDKRISLNKAERPFYIWVLGKQENISYLKSKVRDSSFKGSGIQNSFTLIKSMPDYLDYAILRSPKVGSFEKSKERGEAKTHIVEAQVADKGTKKGFMFTVGVNYANLPLSDEYLMEPDNYEINDKKYSIRIEKAEKGDLYTHHLMLALDDKIKHVPKSTLSVKLKNKMPAWVDELNDDKGENPVADNALHKTYGIKNLMYGFYDAYTMEEQNVITEIKVYIN